MKLKWNLEDLYAGKIDNDIYYLQFMDEDVKKTVLEFISKEMLIKALEDKYKNKPTLPKGWFEDVAKALPDKTIKLLEIAANGIATEFQKIKVIKMAIKIIQKQ